MAFTKAETGRWVRGVAWPAALGVLLVILAGCGSSTAASIKAGSAAKGVSLKGATFAVGGKEFTEQLNLCYLTIDVLESAGAKTVDHCGLNGSATARNALTSGKIDMYWEYTGTAWADYLHQTASVKNPTKLYDEVAQMDQTRHHIKWLTPAPYNSSYAIVVASAAGKKLGISTLSQYAALVRSDPSKAKTCLASEFATRPDGFPGLEKAYSFSLPKSDTETLAEGSIFAAVARGNPCTFGEADDTTDGRIQSDHLRVLDDNKHFFPYYNPALNVRDSVYRKYPQLATIFKRVAKDLTQSAIIGLNADVDVKGEKPQNVVKTWLAQEHLIG